MRPLLLLVLAFFLAGVPPDAHASYNKEGDKVFWRSFSSSL